MRETTKCGGAVGDPVSHFATRLWAGSTAEATPATMLAVPAREIHVGVVEPLRDVGVSLRAGKCTAVVALSLEQCNAQTYFTDKRKNVAGTLIAHDGYGEGAKNAGAHALLAMAQRGRRSRARELDPSSPDVAADLGSLLLDRGELNGAECLARAALAVQPQHHEALVLMGRLFLRRADRKEAREHALWVY